jgi:hypothetical protein
LKPAEETPEEANVPMKEDWKKSSQECCSTNQLELKLLF